MTTKQTADGLINVVSGLGGSKMKRSHNQFGATSFTNFQQMEAAYSEWIPRRIVNTVADDMTREWREFKCEGADELRIEEDRLQVPVSVNLALRWARLYGGGAILMITGQPLDKPLNLNKVKKGDLQRLIVLDRWDMSAQTLNTWNVLASNYLMPEFYTIRGGSQQIHWSHFARFNGEPLPLRQAAQTQGWGDSALRVCLEEVMDAMAGKANVAEMLQEATISIITRDGLADELASDQDTAIIGRYSLFSQMKSVANLALLDGDERFDRQSLSFGGLDSILAEMRVWVAGAAEIPVSRLFGEQVASMGQSGEGDLKNYYNSIRAKQLSQLDSGMRMLDEVLVRSAIGEWSGSFNYVWNPLHQLDGQQVAATKKTTAETDLMYLDMGAIKLSQIQRNLQADEVYQFSDEEIEQQEADEASGIMRDPVDEADEAEVKI